MVRTSDRDFGSLGASARFIGRRLVRIVPLYWIATLIRAATSFHSQPYITALNMLKSLGFIPYLASGAPNMRPILPQGWTLNYEMFFYVLFAACLVLRRGAAVAVLSTVLVAIVASGAVVKPPHLHGEALTLVGFYMAPIMLFFAAGIAIGFAEMRLKTWHAFSAPVTFTLLTFAAVEAFSVTMRLQTPFPVPLQMAFGAAAIATVVSCTTSRPLRERRLATVMVRCGDASYSTYLFHTFVLGFVFKVWTLLPGAVRWWWIYLIMTLVVANLVGYAIHRLVERPFTKWLRQVMPGETGHAAKPAIA